METNDQLNAHRVAGNPGKQRVRDWMNERLISSSPPPGPDEIRRQLGWGLIPNNRSVRHAC